MKDSLSAPRFQRYLADSGGNDAQALQLYQWNSLLSQSLYVYIQSWEICLRNKLNEFLRWKFNPDWPHDEKRAIRSLKGNEQRRLKETIDRQRSNRGNNKIFTDVIVSDLSAGFWVALLSSSYDISYSWRYNLMRIFPHDNSLDRQAAWEICNDALKIRNRVAHHEPIYHLTLEAHYRDFQRIVAAMCPGTFAFANANCTFRDVFNRRPA